MAEGSFFGGVQAGITTPQTVMNSGPLPPLDMGGMPYGLNGTPDARINYNSNLLGDISPYAYGEPGRLSTQSSYINIPNRIQKVVPVVWLPDPSFEQQKFMLSHAVDDGDVAFAVRDLHMKSVPGSKEMNRTYSTRNYHPFINLATTNYLLAGLQIAQADANSLPPSWQTLAASLGLPDDGEVSPEDISYVITPFGVVHGSEKQGGGHEGSNGPVTWASNFVTTMYIDGHVRNLANLWRNVDISAGQHLCFQMRKVPLPELYTLNHYQKATVRKCFSREQREAVGGTVLQLVPDAVGSQTFSLRQPYWRIAMSYVGSPKYTDGGTFYDDGVLLSGALLEASFQPTRRDQILPEQLESGKQSPSNSARSEQFVRQMKDTLSAPHSCPDAPDYKRFASGLFESMRPIPVAVPPVGNAAPLASDAAPPADDAASLASDAAPPASDAAPAEKQPRKNPRKRVSGSVLGSGAEAPTLGDVI